jgi:hypothetical protein
VLYGEGPDVPSIGDTVASRRHASEGLLILAPASLFMIINDGCSGIFSDGLDPLINNGFCYHGSVIFNSCTRVSSKFEFNVLS